MAKKLKAEIEKGTSRQVEHLQTLLDISRQVAAQETLDQVLQTLIDFAAEKTDSDRSSLFLNDSDTGELFTRVAMGDHIREIRILNDQGVAGHVFQSGKGLIVHDAYNHEHFDHSVDQETGYVTQSILCAPVRTVTGQLIGVIQALNKRSGYYTEEDLSFLEDMTTQAAITLKSTQNVERMKISRDREMEFLDLVSDVTSEIELDTMLEKVMREATKMLNAERGTLFLNDEKNGELFSRVAMGDSVGEIRLPNHLGIAGTVFASGVSVNIPHAYADLRFNPAFDKKTGFFTRSILCVPITNKDGKTIGVTQLLNKHGGPFTEADEARLKAFTAQVAISLENAKLFDDVQAMKNYNECMLESMSNGVVTCDKDGVIVTCNEAGLRILRAAQEDILKQRVDAFFTNTNGWIIEKIDRVSENGEMELVMDTELAFGGEQISVNLSVLPLKDKDGQSLGSMLMLEDISGEKRMKSTMSRYMDPGLADQLLDGGEDFLGGTAVTATVLFSDVRSFTSITEELGAQGTVALLNEYFTIMVECIQREGGMLDKFIGDATMAAFGLPVAHDDDEDRAVRTAIAMIRDLWAWNKDRSAEGKRTLDMGVGLNTDVVVSGNIGSPKRMDYTMIGDGVNLAARLESACKQYGARILISENTYAKLKGTYRVRQADRVVVKGKTQPVAIYEVLDYHTPETFPDLMDAVNYYTSGLEHYWAQRWGRAKLAFEKALKLHPGDKLPQLFLQRSAHFAESPPGKDWDGVWVLTSK